MKCLVVAAMLGGILACPDRTHAQLVPKVESSLDTEESWKPIAFDTEYARAILNWQETVTEKPLTMLQASVADSLAPNTLTISGAYWGSYMYEETNVSGKFPILSRFPNQHSGTTGSRWVTNNAAVGLTAKLGSWITLFAQPEFSEIEFVGQDEVQLRKAFVMVGNLSQVPFYAYYGRNTVDFGAMNAYNPFTHTVNNHSFRVDSEDPVIGLGFYRDGLHLVATAIHSGRQLRVADSPGSDGYDENFALHASYAFESGDFRGRVGGGYLHSTIYNRTIPHHPGAGFDAAVRGSKEERRNGAWDVFVEVGYGPFSIGGEYTATTEKWPATDHRVSALNGQFAYDFSLFEMPTRLSFVYGVGRVGPDDTEYERLTQLVVGAETQVTKNFSLGVEYVRNSAFVPLIGITHVSDSSVKTDTLIVGGKLTF